MRRDVAADIVIVASEYAAKLEATLETLRESCPPAEFRRYADGIGGVLEHLHQDILEAIFHEHPDLRPHETTRA